MTYEEVDRGVVQYQFVFWVIFFSHQVVSIEVAFCKVRWGSWTAFVVADFEPNTFHVLNKCFDFLLARVISKGGILSFLENLVEEYFCARIWEDVGACSNVLNLVFCDKSVKSIWVLWICIIREFDLASI